MNNQHKYHSTSKDHSPLITGFIIVHFIGYTNPKLAIVLTNPHIHCITYIGASYAEEFCLQRGDCVVFGIYLFGAGKRSPKSDGVDGITQYSI